PWLSNNSIANPSFIHLWNGEGYRIPNSFWTGSTTSFENHQGEHFKLVRYTSGTISLIASSAVAYSFDSTHKLTKIVDVLGNNITLSYDGSNHLSSIRDTVGRAFRFCYTGGLLTSVEQSSPSCGIGFPRRVVYS